MFSYLSGIKTANNLSKIIISIYQDIVNYLIYKGYKFKTYEGVFILNESYSLVIFMYRIANPGTNEKKLTAIVITLEGILKSTLQKLWSGRIQDENLDSTISALVANTLTHFAQWQEALLTEGNKSGLTGSGKIPWSDAAVAKFIGNLNVFVDHIIDNSDNDDMEELGTKDLVDLHSLVVKHVSPLVS